MKQLLLGQAGALRPPRCLAFPSSLLAGCILLLASNAIHAVNVAPGATQALSGTTSASNPNLAGASVGGDRLHSFVIRDTSNNIVIQGDLQEGVARSNNLGTLIFDYRIRNLSGPAGARITGIDRNGFRNAATDADWRIDGLGDVGPNSVTRSGDGDLLFFRHEPSVIDPPDDGRFTGILTNVPDFDFTGTITIYARPSAAGPIYRTIIEGVPAPGVLDVNSGQSIQSAIDLASPGDTVTVTPGTYREELTLRSDVDVIGAGPGETILEPSTGIGVSATNVTDSEFAGFTVQPAPGSTATTGIRVSGGSPSLRGNHVTGFPEEGIEVVGGSTAFICGNRLEGNFDPGNARLDYNLTILQATPLVTNNLIISGEAGCYIGWHQSDGMQFLNNTVADNRRDGVWCYRSNPVIKNNLVTGNTPGISASFDNATPELTYNNVWDNQGFGNYNAQQTGVINVGTGSISLDPLYDPGAPGHYLLSEGSPCIDAGDPAAIYNDLDGSRNDIGYTGGPCGSPTPPGAIVSGFVWTSVGVYANIEDIEQSGNKRGLTKDRDRPFGGSPWLYGAFGFTETSVARYAVKIAKWTGGTPPPPGAFAYVDDPLSKVRYDISGGTLSTARVALGPFEAFGKPTYIPTRNSGNIFWAHENLRLVLNTNGLENGTYSVRMEAFDIVGNPVSFAVNNDLIMTINNTRPVVSIDAVSFGGGTPFDECSIIRLPSDTSTLNFVYTASHADGFLDNYALVAEVGRNRSGGTIASGSYTPVPNAFWGGVTLQPVAATPVSPEQPLPNLQLWETCAYQFRISAWARTTNGFNRTYWTTFFDNYAIDLNSGQICTPDLDGDGDVDAQDLAIMAAAYGTEQQN